VTAALAAPVLAALAVAFGCLASGVVGIDGAFARIRPLSGAPTRPRRIARWWPPSMVRWLGGALGLLLVVLAPFPGLLLAPVLTLAGWQLPIVFERRSARRRRASVNAQIPQLLDLLAAGSSAGLSGQTAFRRAVDALGGPLAAELRGAMDAADLGARWRDELAAASERLDLPDLRRTVNALSRTDTLGASLSGSTAELAASVRAARRAAVTERARTAPVKMLFPLVLLSI
jgi:tight adherence protein C